MLPPVLVPSARLTALAAFLEGVRDIVDARVLEPSPPSWCEERGWSAFLLGLDDDALSAIEHGRIAQGLSAHPDAPASLRAVAAEALALTGVPRADASSAPSNLRRANERKRVQVAALAEIVRRWAPAARRIVDLGAGHGHLTRELAVALGREALGVERRPHVVENARRLTEAPTVRFVVADALDLEPLALGADDLLVGLHACGALGDGLVQAAAERGSGVLLVSCCPQKIAAPARGAVSRTGRALGLTLRREHLGLANLATRADGAAESEGVSERRRTRRALLGLLREAGVELAPGDEARGLNRRLFRMPLSVVAERGFRARGLPSPSAAAIARAEAHAAEEHASVRRLALPRTMLARALELALVLDRATLLEEAGGPPPAVVEAFDPRASPRNLAIVRAPS